MLGILPIATAPVASLPDSGAAVAPRPGAPYTTLLVQIDFFDPAPLTIRASDRYLGPEWTGDEWLALVAAYGELSESTDGGPGTGELTLTNTCRVAGKPRFSDLLRTPTNLTGTYELVGATVTLSRLAEGATTLFTLGVLVVEEAADIDDRVVRLRLRDASLRFEHQAPLAVISRTDFPSCARDLPGTTIPVPFGAVKGIPVLPIVAGSLGRLVGDLDAVATTFTVTAADGGDLDATDFAALKCLIDFEEIAFTTRVGNVLSGATRAAGAVAHADGADVLEALTTYIYAVGEHAAGYPITSVANVLTQGPRSAAPTITLDQVLNGRHLATISFPRTALESLKPVTSAPLSVTIAEYQVNLVTGNADVSATRVVAIPAAFAYCQRTRRTVTITASRGGSGGNVAGTVHLILQRGLTSASATTIFDTTWANGVVGAVTGGDVISYDSVADETLFIFYNMTGTLNGGTLGIIFTPYTVEVPPGGFPLRPGGPYSSAADAALGPVSCDVIGIGDTATGTITGAAATVLTNPADILRYLLTVFYPAPTLPLGGPSFAASRTALLTRAIVWAFLYGQDGPVALSDLRELAARQTGGALYVEGGAWQFRVAEAPLSIESILDYAREVWDGRPALATRSPSSDVYTSVLASAGWDYQAGAYRLTALSEVAGVRAVQRTLDFPWVQDQATATALAAYWLSVWQRQRWDVELVAWDNLLGLRLGDQLALDGHPVLEAHGGDTLALSITERAYLLADENPSRVRVRAVEAAPWT